MRIPKNPPDTDVIWKSVIKGDRIPLIFRVPETESRGRYLHWDNLRYHQPPNGITHEEWWLSLKIHRERASKAIPLKDKSGRQFQYLLPEPIPERLHEIDLGAGGVIQMPDQITNPQTKDQYYLSSLMEEAITSSQLEGATTTREVAKEMIRAGRPPRDVSERMILNNFLTMQRIGELKNEPLTKDLVFEMHRLITSQTLKDPTAAGRFRNEDEKRVVGDEYGQVLHEPPPSCELEERMEAMCDFANAKSPSHFVHPAIRAIMLHFWLAYDHPFVDGNGRTARAMFYWAMLHYKFWLCEFIAISPIILKGPSKYARAFLYTESDDNDLTYFLIYHLEVVRRSVTQLHGYIKRKVKQLQLIEQELRGMSILNHRQRMLVSHALRHPHHVYLVESHKRSHNVVHQTARSDLLDLRDRGLIIGEKAGKTWRFTPAPGLEKKLAELQR